MPSKSKARVPAPTFKIERFTLPNGLRVVLSPDRSSPAVAITVYYDVGFRSEPKGRTGFAHLFEHLMFEGSATLEKLQHANLIQGNGGSFNGSTSSDYTNYHEQLPSSALELGLFLEADRMTSVRLTEENLHNQIEVVKEEIRVNVLNRPYGGFPWIDLPPIMFRTFNNSHNGYGSFVDLESATIDDAADFFNSYYAPANAVLCVAGDLDVDKAHALVAKHFGAIAKRAAPPVPDCSEPVPTKERRGVKHDPMAPNPALAIGYRVPDPIASFEDYCAATLLSHVLTDGEASRIYQRAVKKDRVASHAFGMMGTFGEPFEVRDPTSLKVLAFHPPGTSAEPIIDVVDDEISRVAAGDVSSEEVERVITGIVSGYFRRVDNVWGRALSMAVLELQRGRAELISELPAALAAVTPENIAKVAATWLRPNSRAVLEVKPGAAA